MKRSIDLENQTALTVDIDALEEIARSLTEDAIELIITDNTNIQDINREHRGKDSPTDVLSFPIETPFSGQPLYDTPLGSIVISAEYVKEKAQLYGHTEEDELKLLFIHGLLHLLGFDHEIDEGEMRQKERELIEKFRLPESLIVRND